MNEWRRRSIVSGRWNIVQQLRRSSIELNLFQSGSIDIQRMQRERVQTRFYMGLLSVSIVILIVYTSVEEHAVVETINPPSNTAEYEYFREIYSDTLACPCSRISFEYNTIIPKLQVESFHPICNSSFLTPRWFDFLLPDTYHAWIFSNQDYNQWMAPLFQLIATLCSVVQDQLNHNLLTFLSSSMVINRLIFAEQFEQQLNMTVAYLQQQILSKFAQFVNSIRLSQRGNALISVIASNWQYVVQNNNRSLGALLPRQPVTYQNGTCSCALSQRCSMPATIFTFDGRVYHTFSGLRLGCTIFESLLQSSLECFYSASCVDSAVDVLKALRYSPDSPYWNTSGLFNPLDNSLSTFADDDTIETIVSRMFINRWQHEISYKAFFHGCAARECTYTHHYRFDALDVITTILSVFSGLAVGLRFVVPHLFAIMDKICRRNRPNSS